MGGSWPPLKRPTRQTYILTIIRERRAQMGSGDCRIRFLFAYKISLSSRPLSRRFDSNREQELQL